MDLLRVEKELKKRWIFPYKWGRKQNDTWDKNTNFIYKTYTFEALEKQLANSEQDLKDYAMNRWYNYWSAKAVEAIFANHKNVIANRNQYDKLVDFTINNIPFDHKTTVFPKGFKQSVSYGEAHKNELIRWLYQNQSQQGRKHHNNRIFVVLYDENGQHWRLKAAIQDIKTVIDNYMLTFAQENLIKLNFNNKTVYSDIIWIKSIIH